jgi:FixJ family two-component response regulator
MPNLPIQVYVVDAAPSLRTAYERLLRSAKMEPRTFASVEDFMRSDFSDENACVIADSSGIELPGLLARAGHHLPVVLVTGQNTSETRDRARREGVAAYFCRPIDDQAMLDAIAWALAGRRCP